MSLLLTFHGHLAAEQLLEALSPSIRDAMNLNAVVSHMASHCGKAFQRRQDCRLKRRLFVAWRSEVGNRQLEDPGFINSSRRNILGLPPPPRLHAPTTDVSTQCILFEEERRELQRLVANERAQRAQSESMVRMISVC